MQHLHSIMSFVQRFIFKSKTTACLLIIVFNNSISYGNVDSVSIPIRKVHITTSVYDYIPSYPINTICFNLGGEIYIGDKRSLFINGGCLKSFAPQSGLLTINALESTGFKIQGEYRRYLMKYKINPFAILTFPTLLFQYNNKSSSFSGSYYAINYLSKFTSIIREERVLTNGIATDSPYTVFRQRYALHFKWGYKSVNKWGIVIDNSLGLGLQYLSSYSEDKINERNNQTDIWGKPFDEGKAFSPSLIYQINIGF